MGFDHEGRMRMAKGEEGIAWNDAVTRGDA